MVTMFSVLAARAEAQIDSNALVTIYCGGVSDGCTVLVDCADGFGWTIGCNVSTGAIGTFNFADIGQSSNPTFQIDTIRNEITNLGCSAQMPIFDDYARGADGESQITLVFSPIPFHFVGKTLEIIPGVYPAVYYFSASVRNGNIHGGCTGVCSDNDSIIDSVFLQISPANSFVSNFPEQNIPFRITSDGANEFFSFNPSPNVMNIDIFNTLGMVVSTISLSQSETWHEVPFNQLPPGIYFARLGDQVAKFVVPPR
jgi:hypothetical protein